MVAQGMGGLMSVTGQANSEPTRVGTSIGDITAALFPTIGIPLPLISYGGSSFIAFSCMIFIYLNLDLNRLN